MIVRIAERDLRERFSTPIAALPSNRDGCPEANFSGLTFRTHAEVTIKRPFAFFTSRRCSDGIETKHICQEVVVRGVELRLQQLSADIALRIQQRNQSHSARW